MRKILSLILCLLLICTTAFASGISVIVDDGKLNMDVEPTVIDGRTFVPLRAIFEALDAQVSWIPETSSVLSRKGDITVNLTLGSNIMYVDGHEYILDVPAFAKDGRTLVPVRAVSEAYDCTVSWNSALNTVHIMSEEYPDWNIPPYSNTPYVAVNNNVPFFNIADYKPDFFEIYNTFDDSGRCTYVMAMLAKEGMPTEKRGDINSVKPTGWLNVKYDNVDGGYLYNRCHLIGFQLSGENANQYNLITGTRYMNTEGMLPFENMVADYIKETGNHVLYRVIPHFIENELVARGVFIEAMSVEDNGEGICFNVFCYNVQPGIEINYDDGSSKAVEPAFDSTMEPVAVTFILNTSTGKFHFPECSAVKKMNDKNREESSLSRDVIASKGYIPCGLCNP